MTLFDLLFALVFLATVVTLVAALIAAFRRRGARRILIGLGCFLAAYLGVVAAVGLLSPQRVVAMNDPQCFDDWCIAVDRVERSDSSASATYGVTLRLSSRARGRPQRENGVRVYLLDERGRRYEPSAEPGGTPLNVLLEPGESVTATRTFMVPPDVRPVGLVVAHGAFPGLFIIGDGQSLLHKPTIMRLR